MSIQLFDTFDDELQLVNYAPLTGATDAVLTTTLANEHVDVRIMLQTAITRTRVMSDLDTDPMSDALLDTDSMTGIESITKIPAEGWVKSGTGVSGIVVDAWATFKGWRAIKATCDGAALAAVLTSMPSTPADAILGVVDVSAMKWLSVVVDDLTTGAVLSGVQLDITSDPNGFMGSFDTLGIALANTRGNEWRADLTTLGVITTDLSFITGVRIHLNGGMPVNNDLIYVFALRAYMDTYDPHVDLDLNTRRGALGVPVTWDLADPTATAVANFIRGTGATSDPTGQDATQRMIMRVGTLFASGTTNTVGFKFRESAGGYIFAQLVWNGTVATWTVGTQAGTLDTHVVGAPWAATIVPNELLVVEARLAGDTLSTRVYLSNTNEQIGVREYTNDVRGLVPASGRIGWYASLKDRDAYLIDFDGFFTSLASATTKVRQYLSPIESLALSASFAADSQNFTDFTVIGGMDVTQDATKFVAPATFSWATRGPIISNSVRIKNFSESYLDFDIWVPLEATDFPSVRLVSNQLAQGIDLPPLILQSNQWTHVHIELADAANSVDDLTYYVMLQSSDGESMPYTFFVSNMGIFTRNVSWLARVNSNFDFREFRDMTNAVDGLLHFPHAERGTELQIAFAALTADAWASSFATKVKYAQLGLPMYYRMDDQATD